MTPSCRFLGKHHNFMANWIVSHLEVWLNHHNKPLFQPSTSKRMVFYMKQLVGVLLLLVVASVTAEEPRFIVAAPDSKDLLTQVSVVTNTVLNRTSNLYTPTLINDTTARIDLTHLVDNEEQLRDLI